MTKKIQMKKKKRYVNKRKNNKTSQKNVKFRRLKKNSNLKKETKKSLIKKKLLLKKPLVNPIISPRPQNKWESCQTFNPAAVVENGKVYLLYRAIGDDGVSRLGYAASADGIHISERLNKPVFVLKMPYEAEKAPVDIVYGSGGSWSGCEDPRLTKIKDRLYMIFVAADCLRLVLTSINLDDFLNKRWKWGGVKIISPPHLVDKSGALFPEKIKGKYVIIHRVFPNILIDFVDDLDFKAKKYLKGEYVIPVRKGFWDSRKIGAGAPPIKTPYGWLLIYYGVGDKGPKYQYKIGAMLLDLKNPTKVLARTNEPILEPVEWYENEGHKAGIAYPCGAAVLDNKLFVYYGGADTMVCVAYTELEPFLKSLIAGSSSKLTKIRKE